jgi:WD40 repeat protein
MKLALASRLLVATLAMAAAARGQIRPDTGPAQIVVDTSPGARIFLDSVLKGTASAAGRLVISEPKHGPHVLRIEKAGKERYTKTLDARRGRTTSIRAELNDLPGVLVILTEPRAEILLDGHVAGVTDSSGRVVLRGVKPKEYTLRVLADGFNPMERMLTVSPGSEITMNTPLKPFRAGPGELSLRVPQYVLQRRMVAYPEGVEGAFFVPGGDELVSWGEHDGAIVWDRRTGRQLRTIEVREERSFAPYLAVSPDLRSVAVRLLGGSHPTRLVDARTGRTARVFSGFGYPRAFTVDSKRIVVGAHPGFTNGGPEDQASLLDVETGRTIKAWKDWSMRAFAISPDGKWIAGGDDYVTVWDAQTGEQVRRIEASARELAFSGDSRLLAIGSEKQIELWEAPPGVQGRTIEAPKSANGEALEFGSVAFIPNSPHLLSVLRKRSSSGDEGLYLWDLQTGKALANWSVQNVRKIALSDDGQWMALTGRDLTVWRRR